MQPPKSIPGSLAADTPEEATAQAETAAQANSTLSAEKDVSAGMDDITAHSFDDIPEDGPLNFEDGTMERPRGDSQRMGGTWEDEGSDSGAIAPPAEIMSDRVEPSDEPDRREIRES
ncbi:serine/threonine protein kinase [Melaminivora suipulveris]|uniref:Serine/threonine protein kinase n=1 Tax=Melaminivora suipulveris TaxID=2109913 RepID=A0A2R3Q7S8_9BURK|nr:serine/threonine protein kinase [Melaminivora suipulveris]AVO47836.1 serine/threonine protein kinase [Melaminivora suipulveris]